MLADQSMQARHAIQTLNDASPGQDLAICVDHAHVVVAFSPVNPNQQRPPSLPPRQRRRRPPHHSTRSVPSPPPPPPPSRIPPPRGGGPLSGSDAAPTRGKDNKRAALCPQQRR